MPYSLDRLMEIVAVLRSQHGCPWDREQTHRTLRPYVIEEAYEVAEAIDSEDPAKLAEELGDLLLQVALHTHIAEEAGGFSWDRVVNGIAEKLTRRHPHVFGDVTVSGADEVLRNWEAIKRKERSCEERRSILDGIPSGIPSLARAEKIGRRAARVGFDWANAGDALLKLEEELEELQKAYSSGETDRIEEELGDLLFAAVNVARLAKVDPEGSLARAVDKFSRRFREMEQLVDATGRCFESMNLEAMEDLWQAVKHAERQGQELPKSTGRD